MKARFFGIAFLWCLLVCFAFPSEAADRVRPGEWETTLTFMGQTVTRSACMSQADADAVNGGAASIKAFVEKASAPAGCHVTDVKISGNQVIVTSKCGAGAPSVGTTTYHGDSSETANSNGTMSRSKWVGACK
jgi:hypothetical protein